MPQIMYNASVNLLHPFFNIVLATTLCVFDAFVISTLWSWYFVPVGLPAIPLLTAFGINLIVTLLTFSDPAVDKPAKLTSGQITARLLRQGFFIPAAFLFWGWVAYALFG